MFSTNAQAEDCRQPVDQHFVSASFVLYFLYIISNSNLVEQVCFSLLSPLPFGRFLKEHRLTWCWCFSDSPPWVLELSSFILPWVRSVLPPPFVFIALPTLFSFLLCFSGVLVLIVSSTLHTFNF